MPVELLVTRVAALSSRVRSFELVDPSGKELPPFEAGAHVTLHLPGGLARQYSLYNDPAERHRYCIAVSLEEAGRGGSRHMHVGISEGDRVEVSEPRNLFRLAPDARRHLLIAGGIGITPMLSMVQHLSGRGDDFRLIYLVRSSDDAPFVDALGDLRFDGRVTIHGDDGDPGKRFPLAEALSAPDAGTHAYCCGPAPLMDAVRSITRDWPEDTVHFEAFTASGEPTDGAAFKVKLARSGKEVEVASDETILDALLRVGVDVDYSCKEGTCGTCMATILEGVADHRDSVLTPKERSANRDILICCSRASSPSLTLDL